MIKSKNIFLILMSTLFLNNIHSQEQTYNIPFVVVKNRIFIEGEINGRACQIMYDTGAIGFNVDKSFF